MESREGTMVKTVDANSLALQYEIKLKEDKFDRKKSVPSEKRLVSVFKVFDEVIPNLGVYSKVLKMIRNDLFHSVYSQEYTGASEMEIETPMTPRQGSRAGSKSPADKLREKSNLSDYIQRIPYFVIVRDIHDKINEEAETLKEQVVILKKRLGEKHHQYDESLEVNDDLKREIANLNKIIQDKNNEISKRESEIDELYNEIDKVKADIDIQRMDMEEDKEKVVELMNDARNEIKFLEQYKYSYDKLHQAFILKPEEEVFGMGKVPVLATKKAQLVTNLDAAKNLEQQLLIVQNQIIEEYDVYVEQHRRNLINKTFKDNYGNTFDKEEQELAVIDKELEETEKRFRKTIMALNDELDMIRQQKEMIMQQLEEIVQSAKSTSKAGTRPTSKDANTPASVRSNDRDSKAKDRDSVVSSLSEEFLLDAEEVSTQMDPFVAQEAIMSKYAVMIYTSTNRGKTYYEIKDAKFCPSCGEKTAVCPHKVRTELILQLPINCTHVRICRPKIKIALAKRKRPKLKSRRGKPETGFTPTSLSMKRMKSRGSIFSKTPLPTKIDSVTPGAVAVEGRDQTVLGGSEELQMLQKSLLQSFMKLWDDYFKRTEIDRTIERPLPLKRTLSLISQCYAYMLWQDDSALDDEPIYSMLDSLYNYMSERYLLEDVMYLGMHDFLSGIFENCMVNKTVQVFAHTLVGNLDGATFRYMLVIADLIDKVEWKEVSDFRAFADSIYPFLRDDDLDQITLQYTAFTENKISKGLINEYLLYNILKYREPRFLHTEAKLLQYPGRTPGVLTDQEFSKAMDAMSPLYNERMRRRYFAEAQEQLKQEKLPIMRLSQISSLLQLLQIAPLLRQNINETVRLGRFRAESRMSKMSKGSDLAHHSRLVEGDDQIMTYTKLRNLAKNLAKEMNVRTMGKLEYEKSKVMEPLEEESDRDSLDEELEKQDDEPEPTKAEANKSVEPTETELTEVAAKSVEPPETAATEPATTEQAEQTEPISSAATAPEQDTQSPL